MDVTKYHCRTEAFKSFFFPWNFTESNSLDLKIGNLSYTGFRKHFIDEFRPAPNSGFNISNPRYKASHKNKAWIKSFK